MKKHLFFKIALLALITGALALFSSCSCNPLESIIDQLTADPDEYVSGEPETFSPEEEKIQEVLTGKKDLDEMSVDELLAYVDALQDEDNEALNQGAAYDLLYKDTDQVEFDANAESDFRYAAGAKVTTVSDDPWKEGDFEELDITAGMSPQEKAEYEAMMQELENFDAAEFQAEMDEMLQGMEGFEDYEPETDENDDPGDTPELLDKWPDNEITRQAPVPPFAGSVITADEDSVTLYATGAAEADVRSYVAAAKAKGFTIDANETDQEVAGYRIYSYTAENAAGYQINVSFVGGAATVVISR